MGTKEKLRRANMVRHKKMEPFTLMAYTAQTCRLVVRRDHGGVIKDSRFDPNDSNAPLRAVEGLHSKR